MAGQIYEIIQKQVIDKLQHAIDTGEKFTWVKPWSGGAPYPCSYFSHRKPFASLINMILLDEGEYITFAKMKELQGSHPELGIKLKKGSKAVPVYQNFPVFQKDTNGNYQLDEEGNKIIENYSLRFVREFHIEDVEGLIPHFEIKEFTHTENEDMVLADQYIEVFCKEYGIEVRVRNGGNRAFYRPSDNSVTLPNRNQFESIYEYYSTVFHEIAGHGTGKLCGRELAGRDDIEAYALEELVAEITASTACTHFRIFDDAAQENNVAYLQGWITKLKGESGKLIKLAADQAGKAFETFLQAYESPAIVKQQKLEPEVVMDGSSPVTGKVHERMKLHRAEYKIPEIYRKKADKESGVHYSIVYQMQDVEKCLEKTFKGGYPSLMDSLKAEGCEDLGFLTEHLELSKTIQGYQTYFRYNRDQIPVEKSNAFMQALGTYAITCRNLMNAGMEISDEIPKPEHYGILISKDNMERQAEPTNKKAKRCR